MGLLKKINFVIIDSKAKLLLCSMADIRKNREENHLLTSAEIKPGKDGSLYRGTARKFKIYPEQSKNPLRIFFNIPLNYLALSLISFAIIAMKSSFFMVSSALESRRRIETVPSSSSLSPMTSI